MTWHFLTDMTQKVVFCRHCGSKCGSLDTTGRTHHYCRNPWCKNMKVLYHDRQEDVWTIVEAKEEFVRLANQVFKASWGTVRQP